jgi:hypothetical protein
LHEAEYQQEARQHLEAALTIFDEKIFPGYFKIAHELLKALD